MTVLMVSVPSQQPLRPSDSRRSMLITVGFAVLWGLLTLWTSGCGSRSSRTVVLYCAQDQVLAEPLLARFEAETGWSVRTVYDSEAVKTVGLANRLLAERSHPVADVFWGNEPFRAHLLIARGVLEGPETLAVFGRRSRQWVIPEGGLPGGGVPPQSLRELTNATWRGKVSLAFPLFGTTSTHFHALRQHWGEAAWRSWCEALMANKPFIEEGNSQVVQRVARGEATIGLTDSDDIEAARREGLKVRVGGPLLETLALPNVATRIVGAPNPEGAKALIDYLRSPGVEQALVAAGGLERVSTGTNRVELHPRWEPMIQDLEQTQRQLGEIFRR